MVFSHLNKGKHSSGNSQPTTDFPFDILCDRQTHKKYKMLKIMLIRAKKGGIAKPKFFNFEKRKKTPIE